MVLAITEVLFSIFFGSDVRNKMYISLKLLRRPANCNTCKLRTITIASFPTMTFSSSSADKDTFQEVQDDKNVNGKERLEH